MVNKKKILIYAHVGNPENIYSHKKKQHDSFTQSISNTNANITNHHCKTKSVLHPYSLFWYNSIIFLITKTHFSLYIAYNIHRDLDVFSTQKPNPLKWNTLFLFLFVTPDREPQADLPGNSQSTCGPRCWDCGHSLTRDGDRRHIAPPIIRRQHQPAGVSAVVHAGPGRHRCPGQAGPMSFTRWSCLSPLTSSSPGSPTSTLPPLPECITPPHLLL